MESRSIQREKRVESSDGSSAAGPQNTAGKNVQSACRYLSQGAQSSRRGCSCDADRVAGLTGTLLTAWRTLASFGNRAVKPRAVPDDRPCRSCQEFPSSRSPWPPPTRSAADDGVRPGRFRASGTGVAHSRDPVMTIEATIKKIPSWRSSTAARRLGRSFLRSRRGLRQRERGHDNEGQNWRRKVSNVCVRTAARLQPEVAGVDCRRRSPSTSPPSIQDGATSNSRERRRPRAGVFRLPRLWTIVARRNECLCRRKICSQ